MQVVGANKGGVIVLVEGLRGFVPFSQISAVCSLNWHSFCWLDFTNFFIILPCGHTESPFIFTFFVIIQLGVQISDSRPLLDFSHVQFMSDLVLLLLFLFFFSIQCSLLLLIIFFISLISSYLRSSQYVYYPVHLFFLSIYQKSTAEELLNKELRLKFVEVDEKLSRLILSNCKAIANSKVEQRIGSVVTGTVQILKPYGAFIDIGGINGLLHVSQISQNHISDIGTVLQPGDILKVFHCQLRAWWRSWSVYDLEHVEIIFCGCRSWFWAMTTREAVLVFLPRNWNLILETWFTIQSLFLRRYFFFTLHFLLLWCAMLVFSEGTPFALLTSCCYSMVF